MNAEDLLKEVHKKHSEEKLIVAKINGIVEWLTNNNYPFMIIGGTVYWQTNCQTLSQDDTNVRCLDHDYFDQLRKLNEVVYNDTHSTADGTFEELLKRVEQLEKKVERLEKHFRSLKVEADL